MSCAQLPLQSYRCFGEQSAVLLQMQCTHASTPVFSQRVHVVRASCTTPATVACTAWTSHCIICAQPLSSPLSPSTPLIQVPLNLSLQHPLPPPPPPRPSTGIRTPRAINPSICRTPYRSVGVPLQQHYELSKVAGRQLHRPLLQQGGGADLQVSERLTRCCSDSAPGDVHSAKDVCSAAGSGNWQ